MLYGMNWPLCSVPPEDSCITYIWQSILGGTLVMRETNMDALSGSYVLTAMNNVNTITIFVYTFFFFLNCNKLHWTQRDIGHIV